MIRAYIAVVMLLTAALARAQQSSAVFEVSGVLQDQLDRPVRPPITVQVVPCGAADVDSDGNFRANCSTVNVHAGQPIFIRVTKDGWVPVARATAAPEGGVLAEPIHIQRTPTRSFASPAPLTRSLVSAKVNVDDANFETTLTVVISNLDTLRILIDDLIIHIDQVCEIRHAIGLPLGEQPPSLAEKDLPLMSSRSESYKHFGRQLDSTSESPPFVFHLVNDDSSAADRDFIYRAWVEVTWKRAGDPREQRVAAGMPLLFLIRGPRGDLEVTSTTQEQTKAMLQWNRQQVDQLAGVNARRTKAADSLIARVKRFEPKDVQPNLTLRGATHANVATVQSLLLASADLSKAHDLKQDLIYTAAQAGNWDVVSLLIDEGTSLSFSVGEFAGKAGKTDIVLRLISNGVSPSAALRGGAEGGHLDIVKLAFDRGAEAQTVDLCSAVLGRNIDVLKLFLSKGVKTSSETCRDLQTYRRWKSPIALAAETLQEDMLRPLLENMFPSESQRRVFLGSLVADEILQGLESRNPASMRQVVALLLHLNADVHDIGGKLIASDAEIAKMLVTAGADINSAAGAGDLERGNTDRRGIFPLKGKDFDRQNGTALLYAVRESNCNLHLVETLRALGAKKVPFRRRRDDTDLVQLALEGYIYQKTPENFELVKCWFLAGAAVPADDAPLAPWLIAVAVSRDVPLVRLLLENGAAPNVKGPGGKTALLAVLESVTAIIGVQAMKEPPSIELVKLLLDKGADPNIKDDEGRSPLAAALEWNPVPMDIVLLLGKKAKYDLTGFSSSGFSPLTKCAFFDDLPCVQYLLSNGEDPRKRDQDKRTPIELAKGNQLIEKALQEAMKHPKR